MNHRLCSLVFVTLLSLLATACSAVQAPEISYDPDALKFSGERAYEIEEQFVTTYTDRVSGTEQSRLATEWIRQQFEALGWSCEIDAWDTINYSVPVIYRNVICRLPGEMSEDPREILVLSHHDIAPTTIQGADNDGSGVAIMLHLAEIFAQEAPQRYGLVFLITDAEEYGMVGSHRFIETYPNPEEIIAGISLDNLGREYYDKMIIESSGQFKQSDYGPIWVALVAQDAARAREDLWEVIIKDPVSQALEQAVPISFTDQGPLITAGVPAIGFGAGYPSEYSDEHYRLWHDPDDSMERQSPESLGQSGLLTEAWIRQLLSMERFPEQSGPYLYFEASKSTLRGAPLYLIFIVFLSLFFVGSYFSGRKSLQEKLDGWRNALPHFLGLWLPLVASLLLVYIFVEIRIMDKYELYPATTKDPAMLNPSWLAVILLLAGLGVSFYIGRRLLMRLTTGEQAPEFSYIKSLAFLIIGVISVYVVIVNPFALLFFIPLLFWLLIRGREGIGKLLDILFFLLGGLMFYLTIYYFGFKILRYGIVFLWYFLNAISSRMFSFGTVLGGLALFAAGLSMVVNPPRRAVAESSE